MPEKLPQGWWNVSTPHRCCQASLLTIVCGVVHPTHRPRALLQSQGPSLMRPEIARGRGGRHTWMRETLSAAGTGHRGNTLMPPLIGVW